MGHVTAQGSDLASGSRPRGGAVQILAHKLLVMGTDEIPAQNSTEQSERRKGEKCLGVRVFWVALKTKAGPLLT